MLYLALFFFIFNFFPAFNSGLKGIRELKKPAQAFPTNSPSTDRPSTSPTSSPGQSSPSSISSGSSQSAFRRFKDVQSYTKGLQTDAQNLAVKEKYNKKSFFKEQIIKMISDGAFYDFVKKEEKRGYALFDTFFLEAKKLNKVDSQESLMILDSLLRVFYSLKFSLKQKNEEFLKIKERLEKEPLDNSIKSNMKRDLDSFESVNLNLNAMESEMKSELEKRVSSLKVTQFREEFKKRESPSKPQEAWV